MSTTQLCGYAPRVQQKQTRKSLLVFCILECEICLCSIIMQKINIKRLESIIPNFFFFVFHFFAVRFSHFVKKENNAIPIKRLNGQA